MGTSHISHSACPACRYCSGHLHRHSSHHHHAMRSYAAAFMLLLVASTTTTARADLPGGIPRAVSALGNAIRHMHLLPHGSGAGSGAQDTQNDFGRQLLQGTTRSPQKPEDVPDPVPLVILENPSPPPPQNVPTWDLTSPSLDPKTRALWRDIQHDMIHEILKIDPYVPCGPPARVWWRILFHDFGTYNRFDNTGGLDGSIQYELDRKENGDFTGMIPSLKTYHKIKARYGERGPVTMADIVVMGGFIGVAACGGPRMEFIPGRKDALQPNKAGLLPGDNDTASALLDKFDRMGLGPANMTAMIGAGHTIAVIVSRVAEVDHMPLDSTVDVFDNLYFKQMLNNTVPFFIPADKNVLRSHLRSYYELYAANNSLWVDTVVATTKYMISRPLPASKFQPPKNATAPSTPSRTSPTLPRPLTSPPPKGPVKSSPAKTSPASAGSPVKKSPVMKSPTKGSPIAVPKTATKSQAQAKV